MAMISIAIVLGTIIGTINVMNYINMNHTVRQRMEMIIANDGKLVEEKKNSAVGIGEKADGNEAMPRPKELDRFRGEFREAPFDTRFFTVEIAEDRTITSVNVESIAAISNEEARAYAVELLEKGEESGYIDCYRYQWTGEMYVFLNVERELNSFYNFLKVSVGTSIMGLCVFFLLVCISSKIVMRPVAESYAKQKRFITDASHEIKTPLTIIDANTEVIEMMEGESEWTQSIRNQIKRLTELTNKLVFLSKMDEENLQLEKEWFSLSNMMEDVIAEYIPMVEVSGRELQKHIAGDIKYCGDEGNLRRMVALLLDNAMKYTDEKGKITVELSEKGKNKVLTFYNTVETIEKGSQMLLFERFYRPDASRNSSTGGHGIGLSVVQAIAQAHKGKVEAYSKDGKSITFTITL